MTFKEYTARCRSHGHFAFGEHHRNEWNNHNLQLKDFGKYKEKVKRPAMSFQEWKHIKGIK